MAKILTIRLPDEAEGVTASIAANPYRFGIDNQKGPWREVKYHIFDQENGLANEAASKFCDALLGVTVLPTVVTDLSLLNRILPHRYPGNTRLVCLSAQGELLGANRPSEPTGKMVESNFASVVAYYGVPDYPVEASDDPDGAASLAGGPYPFVMVGVSTSTRSISRSGFKQKVADGEMEDPDIIVPARVQYQYPLSTYHFKYANLPALGDWILEALNGTVNADAIFGKEPGTLRFDGGESMPQVSARGDRNFTMDFQVIWDKWGWNKVWIPGRSEPIEVETEEDSEPIYPSANWSILTSPALPAPGP